MGWTKEIVDDAREILYNFIKTEIGEEIDSLKPVFHQQDVWETWNMSRLSRCDQSKKQLPSCKRIEVEEFDEAPLEIGAEFNETNFEEVEIHQDDAAACTTDAGQDQEKLAKTAHELSSANDDLVKNMNHPPMKMKTELKFGQNTWLMRMKPWTTGAR